MAQQVINIGASPNDGTGDQLRTAFEKCNDNFTELYSATGEGVPYTGATQNVDLGEYELKAGQIEFDQTPTGTAGEAIMRWNDQDGTVDLGLKGGNVTLQIGQESVIRVVNKTGTNLLEANYQAVRVDGAQGNRLKIALAQATTDLLSAETIGLVTETINNNQEGFVTTNGIVRNIDTTGSLQGETWADGDMLYLSPTVAGRLTKVKPTAPNHLVVIGYVVRAHATQGQIFVKVDNGYELDELHNVAITSPANNNVLTYNSSTDVWENKTVVQALGYTPLNKAGDTITGNVGNTATGSFEVPSGTTAQRPATPTNKMIRYNTDEGYLETFDTFWGWMPLANSNEWKRKWGFEYWNDFGLNNTFTDGVFAILTRNGGLASYTTSPVPSNLNWAGIQGLQTGPNANGQSVLRTDFNQVRYLPFNSGRKSIETSVYLQNLSDSTNRYNLIFGMSNEENSTQANGVVFIYDEGGVGTGTTASPNWQIITSNGSVRTAIVTSVVVNAQQWYKLRIETNENSTEIYYYINDILVRTETTNIPITRNETRPVISITKTVGTTTRAVLVDYMGMKVKFNTAR